MGPLDEFLVRLDTKIMSIGREWDWSIIDDVGLAGICIDGQINVIFENLEFICRLQVS